MKINHPWEDFLKVRARAILWLAQNEKYSDKEIARILSMDVGQVLQIKEYSIKEENERTGK